MKFCKTHQWPASRVESVERSHRQIWGQRQGGGEEGRVIHSLVSLSRMLSLIPKSLWSCYYFTNSAFLALLDINIKSSCLKAITALTVLVSASFRVLVSVCHWSPDLLGPVCNSGFGYDLGDHFQVQKYLPGLRTEPHSALIHFININYRPTFLQTLDMRYWYHKDVYDIFSTSKRLKC